ncbi:MAG: hypothetical protein WCC08_24610 [Terrimicrobiaceae bacterium]
MIAEESQEGQGDRRVLAAVTRLVTLVPNQPDSRTALVELAAFKNRSIRFRGLGTGG